MRLIEPANKYPSKLTTIKITLEQVHGGSHLIGRLRVDLTGSKYPDAELKIPEKIAKIIRASKDEQSPEHKGALALHYLRTKNSENLATLPDPGVRTNFIFQRH